MAKSSIHKLSLKVSDVMEDIGVTEELIKFRRYTFFLIEILSCMSMELYHIVGSQIEGSTTLGMKSDADELACVPKMIAFLDLPEQSFLENTLLVVKNPWSFPQCCSLQPFGPISGFMFNQLGVEKQFVYDQKGRKMLSNKWFLSLIMKEGLTLAKRCCEQNGPAVTIDNMDSVLAIYCQSLHDGCRKWMTRPRPGHWPKQETLEKAKQCGMFLVHPGMIGHYFSHDSMRGVGYMDKQCADDYASAQWRMSTNKIEQLLVFDLNIVQMKALILLKMVRKEILNPLFENILSTFHMKTAVLFTVEQYPEHIWRNENLVKCVLYCLNTLRRFLKRRVCPHYTVEYVNLFPLKLKLHYFVPLINAITTLINSNLQCVYDLQMDKIGKRLSVNPDSRLSSRKENRITIFFALIWESRAFFRREVHYHAATLPTKSFECLIRKLRNYLSAKKNGIEFSNELLLFFEITSCILASIKASKCIANEHVITKDIVRLYKESLVSGQIPLLLKFASMLVQTKYFEEADALIEAIEMKIKPDMFQLAFKIDDSVGIFELDSDVSIHKSTPRENYLNYVSKAIFPVDFTRHEINSAPFHLQYEMHRTITPDDEIARRSSEDLSQWTLNIVSDAKPFLYYLKFLVSKRAEKKAEALIELIKYCETINDEGIEDYQGHFETALNMLGHLLELVNDKSFAWIVYRYSLNCVPFNNAAYWHLFRLLGQYVYQEVSDHTKT